MFNDTEIMLEINGDVCAPFKVYRGIRQGWLWYLHKPGVITLERLLELISTDFRNEKAVATHLSIKSVRVWVLKTMMTIQWTT